MVIDEGLLYTYHSFRRHVLGIYLSTYICVMNAFKSKGNRRALLKALIKRPMQMSMNELFN